MRRRRRGLQSRASPAKLSGCGSQGSCPSPNPAWSSPARHGSGTRQPSRPSSLTAGAARRWGPGAGSSGMSIPSGQAELLALVEVGAAGQGEHEHGRAAARGAGRGRRPAAGPRCRCRRRRAAPGRCSPSRVAWRTTSWLDSTQVLGAPTASSAVSDVGDDVAQVRVPSRPCVQVGEVEGLVHLVAADVLGQPGRRVAPTPRRTGSGRAVVLVEDPRATGGRSRARRPGPTSGRRGRRQPSQLSPCRRRPWLQSGRPSALTRPCATSTRKPSTPRSSQNAQDRARTPSRTSGLLPVEVGLLGVEEVQVPLAGRAVGFGDPGPGRAAEARTASCSAARSPSVAAAVAEDVARRARGCPAAGGQRRLEPRVLVGGVVGDEVDDDLQAELVRPASMASKSARVPNSGSTSR